MNPEDKIRIHEEIFQFVYNSNGGFTHDELYSMPIYLRYFNMKLLVNQKQKEKETSEKQPNTHSPISKGPSKVSPRKSPK